MTQTQEIIIKMLSENTGMNFLVLGRDNNCHWQRKQTKDFLNTPMVTVDSDGWGVTVDTFQYLSEILCTDGLTKSINNEIYLLDDWKDWEEIESLLNRWGFEIDKSIEVKELNNTYNFDNFFSQDFEYMGFALTNGSYYVIISSHNGADIRGGYSRPYMFKFSKYDPYSCYWQFPHVFFYGYYKDEIIEEVTSGGIYTEEGFQDWGDVEPGQLDIYVTTDF